VRPILLTLVAAISLLTCGCYRDITYEPSSHFSHLANTCVALRQKTFVTRSSYADLGIAYLLKGGLPRSEEEYLADDPYNADLGVKHLVGALSPGTRIRVERLMENPWTTAGNPQFAVGEVLDGEYKGKTILVGILLRWDGTKDDVREEYVSKCE
jgi:hypothetical protein